MFSDAVSAVELACATTHRSSMEKLDLLGERCKTEMVPRDVWEESLKFVTQFDKRLYLFKGASLFQCYYMEYFKLFVPSNEYSFCIGMPKRRIYNLKKDASFPPPRIMERHLCYPQCNLDEKYEKFLRENDRFFSSSLVSKINECKLLYKEIVAVEKDDVKWFEALKEAKDHLFLCHNVEYRLGRNLENKALWKLYLGYLMESDHKLLLQTYSRYVRCSCFRDDGDMLREYEETAVRLSMVPVAVPWENPLPFEKYDGQFYARELRIYMGDDDYHMGHKRPIDLYFTPTNAIDQFFTLPAPMIKYIRENSSAEVLQKLYESCKIFYIRTPRTVCYKFKCFDEHRYDMLVDSDSDSEGGDTESVPIAKFVENNIEVDGHRLEEISIPLLYISKVFLFDQPFKLLSFLSRISRCTAEIVSIQGQVLQLEHLRFLLQHGKTSFVDFFFPDYDLNQEMREFKKAVYDFALEDVMEMVPMAKKIVIYNVHCTSETSRKLAAMEFVNKISVFDIAFFSSTKIMLDPKEFGKFVVKSCVPNAQIRIRFSSASNPCKENFKAALSEVIAAEWGQDLKTELQIL